MNILDDFLAMNPESSYEDFMKINELMIDPDLIDHTQWHWPVRLEPPVVNVEMITSLDIFNPHFVNPMDVDIMSGIPSSEFHANAPIVGTSPSVEGSEVESYDQMRLDKGNEIEAMRDAAVEHYKDAKASGNIDEMLKWEAEANKQQGRLYDHWGTPTYGLPPKAPGID